MRILFCFISAIYNKSLTLSLILLISTMFGAVRPILACTLSTTFPTA